MSWIQHTALEEQIFRPKDCMMGTKLCHSVLRSQCPGCDLHACLSFPSFPLIRVTGQLDGAGFSFGFS